VGRSSVLNMRAVISFYNAGGIVVKNALLMFFR
jgi:hypothetical protein